MTTRSPRPSSWGRTGFRSDRFALALALASVWFVASPVTAQDAVALIEQGRALRQAHDDLGALALFEQAYRITPSPRALAQIGYAELALGRWVEGEGHVEEAFANASDAWIATPEAQAGHAAARAQIDRHVSSLEIVVSVPGAELTVGARTVGTSPLAGPVRVEIGETTVRAHLEGYDDTAERVSIEPGHPSRVEMALVRTASAIAVVPDSVPPPAPRDDGPDVAFVVGAIGVAVGGASLLLAIVGSAVVASNDTGLAACDYGASDPCAGWRSDVGTAEALQWAGYAVGGAALLGGAIAMIVSTVSASGSSDDRANGLACAPGALGVTCVGHF